MTLGGRAPLVFIGLGTASMAYGSVARLPGAAEGQIVATVFVGAALLLVGALHFAALLAWRPSRADALLEATLAHGGLSRVAPTLCARTSFADVPFVRWGLCLALVAAALFAAAVVASDVFAWTRLGWTIPDGADRVILG